MSQPQESNEERKLNDDNANIDYKLADRNSNIFDKFISIMLTFLKEKDRASKSVD